MERKPLAATAATKPSSSEAMDMGKISEAFSQQLQIEDIDLTDADNPQLCAEYAKDIYKYMKELEVRGLLLSLKVPLLLSL